MRYEIGQRVVDYVITDYIGSGAAGHVFKVEHIVTRRQEAMKVMLAGPPTCPARVERFLREAKLQAKLNHPNITAIHNAFWVEGDLAIVMELVEGHSLRQVIDAGPIPFITAFGFARQILSALGHAHENNVVHRD